jgi:hypothetical protein
VRLAALVVVLLALVAGVALASADPRGFVLRLQDMPTGFKVKSAGVKSAASAVKEGGVTLAQLKSWGYVAGYEADFDRDVTPADAVSGGAIEILSAASVYRTKQGAEKSLASSAAVCNKSPSQELSVGAKIGDEAHLCSGTSKSNGYTFKTYILLWRRGALKAAVIVAGLKGGVSPGLAVSLAKVQDKRMR